MRLGRAEPAVAGLFAAWALIAGGAGSALVAEEKIRVLIVRRAEQSQLADDDPANWRQMGFFNDSELIVGQP